jgi:uncharacterized protein (TIGR03067 family)
MKFRLGLALLAFAALTAFAPAPFPKSARRDPQPEISLKSFQGKWRVTGVYSTRTDGQHIPETHRLTHIRITDDRWTFIPDNYSGARLDIAIDHLKQPAELTFYSVSDPKKNTYGVGLIRRRQNKVEILYYWGGEEYRPRGFDPAPDAYYLLTLERE